MRILPVAAGLLLLAATALLIRGLAVASDGLLWGAAAAGALALAGAAPGLLGRRRSTNGGSAHVG